MREPANISELWSFLGQSAREVHPKPLRELLSKKNMWCWRHDQQKAFCSLKHKLTSMPVLQLYDPNSPLRISADAPSYGLGAVLLQKKGEVWLPVTD